MQEQKEKIELLKKTVKELLSIVEHADKIAVDRLQMQCYFIKNRNRITELGKIVVMLCGMPEDSVEALKFGKLVVCNYICRGIKSTEFLKKFLTDHITNNMLKNEITLFVKSLMMYLSKDKESLEVTIQKERKILQKLKQSEKAAKHDPIWKKEIEILEKRIKNISILISDKKQPKHKDVKESNAKTEKKEKGQGSSQDFMDLIETFSRLVCFCNFKKNKKPSKYDLLREITLQILESEQICYVSIIPAVCQENRKICIGMCSPTGMETQFISNAQNYIAYIFTEFMMIRPEKALDSIKECLATYKKIGQYRKEEIQKVFLELAPNRMPMIQKTISSYTSRIFYINIIRSIYLIIHDFVCASMLKYKKIENMEELTSVFFRENRKYHRDLIKRHACWMPPQSLPAQEPVYLKGHLSAAILLTGISDIYYLVRAISRGVFAKEPMLSEYYKEYHAFRVSVLNTLLDILSRKIAEKIYAEVLEKKRAQESISQNKEPPKELVSLIRRRILSILHTVAIRFIKSKSRRPRVFISTIRTKEFEKKGLSGYHKEIYMFLIMALPFFAFSASILHTEEP